MQEMRGSSKVIKFTPYWHFIMAKLHSKCGNSMSKRWQLYLLNFWILPWETAFTVINMSPSEKKAVIHYDKKYDEFLRRTFWIDRVLLGGYYLSRMSGLLLLINSNWPYLIHQQQEGSLPDNWEGCVGKLWTSMTDQICFQLMESSAKQR